VARTEFDADYYARFYRDRRRRVAAEGDTARLCAFVAAYLVHLGVKVRSVLDLGCGLGWWRAPAQAAWPGVRYRGVEWSHHLCDTLGWTHGSVVDHAGAPADLVVCQGVLQYLSDRDAARALANLGRLSRRALYLEAVTEEDWNGLLDRARSDQDIHVRPAVFYRTRLARHFVSCGGGLYVPKAQARLFELEKGR